jgi:hypothetical protein
MQHLTWGDAGLFVLFCITLLICWRIAVWIATGRMRLYTGTSNVKYTTMQRNPGRFWLNLGVYVVIVVLLLLVCGSGWLELARKITA